MVQLEAEKLMADYKCYDCGAQPYVRENRVRMMHAENCGFWAWMALEHPNIAYAQDSPHGNVA